MHSGLLDRLRETLHPAEVAPEAPPAPTPAPAPEPELPAVDERYERTRAELHAELVDSLDLEKVQSMSRAELEPRLRELLTDLFDRREAPLTRVQRDRLTQEILDEVLGFGPLERLMRDPEIADILVNGHETIYIEVGGRLRRVALRFRDDEHLLHVIHRVVATVGRRIDESTPMVDARMPDGSRFNAVIPPLAVDGPSISIRKFGTHSLTGQELVNLGALPLQVLELLEGCVRARLNVLISGGTGTGKTTLLNSMSSFIPTEERVITIEDAAELRLLKPHVVRLESRPPNLEGRGEVTTRDLVRNALRMRPDRIIVGEIRGQEAIDMLQAMNTGHEGSLSTIHANSPRHALRRLETMVGLGMGNIQGTAIREMIADALHLVIQVKRLSDGSRRVVSLTEVTGMEGPVISSQEIFRFRQTRVEPGGKVRGVFEGLGVRPVFSERLRAAGVEVPAELVSFREEV